MDPFPLVQRGVRVKSNKFCIHPLSDVHVGADRHQRAALQFRLDYILKQSDEHRVIAHGDWGDIRNKDGKSFSHGAMTPDQEFDEVYALLLPLAKAGRIDLIMPGNHEDRIRKTVGFDWMAKLAAALGIYDRYSPGPALLTHTFGDKKSERSVTGFVHHGFGGGKLPGASMNNVLSMANICPDVDYTIMGHVHHTGSVKSIRYIGAKPHEIAHVLTGTFVDYEPYAQAFGLTPSRVGAPYIYVGDWGFNADGNLINVVV
jgi:UDP-2,3-diacylglucosamine pyrophosphatase LpxH